MSKLYFWMGRCMEFTTVLAVDSSILHPDSFTWPFYTRIKYVWIGSTSIIVLSFAFSVESLIILQLSPFLYHAFFCDPLSLIGIGCMDMGDGDFSREWPLIIAYNFEENYSLPSSPLLGPPEHLPIHGGMFLCRPSQMLWVQGNNDGKSRLLLIRVHIPSPYVLLASSVIFPEP